MCASLHAKVWGVSEVWRDKGVSEVWSSEIHEWLRGESA